MATSCFSGANGSLGNSELNAADELGYYSPARLLLDQDARWILVNLSCYWHILTESMK